MIYRTPVVNGIIIERICENCGLSSIVGKVGKVWCNRLTRKVPNVTKYRLKNESDSCKYYECGVFVGGACE